MAYPYLKWITSRCCYGIPYFKPYDPEGGESGAGVGEENEQLINTAGTNHCGQKTFTVNGKEYKKRSKKVKKNNVSKDAANAEPLAQLGFGIVAYTGMLYYMIWAFALYTLLLIPTFYFYAAGTAYAGVDDQSKLAYAPRTIGALGYSSYQCSAIPVQIESTNFSVSCDFGVIGPVSFGETFYAGVNPKAARGSCMDNELNSACKITNTAGIVAQLTPFVGKQSATIQISQADLYTAGTVPPASAGCDTEDAFVYAQYQCIQEESMLHQKYFQMATTVAICILISYLFTISLRHLYQGGKVQQLEWDMSTITAGDYTVELVIDETEYRQWYNHEYRKDRGDYENKISPALSLKSFLVKNIEETLTQELQRSPLH